jgi:hypothetical protein
MEGRSRRSSHSIPSSTDGLPTKNRSIFKESANRRTRKVMRETSNNKIGKGVQPGRKGKNCRSDTSPGEVETIEY